MYNLYYLNCVGEGRSRSYPNCVSSRFVKNVHIGIMMVLLKLFSPRQLTVSEMTKIDVIMRVEKGSATDASRQINELRRTAKVKCVHKNTVHRYAGGLTHQRGALEKRGRKRVLSKLDVRRLDQARRRLIKRSANTYRVTYDAIIKEAALPHSPGNRVCKDALRNLGVSYKTPRRKFAISDQDAKKRLVIAKAWVKRPDSY